MESLEELKKQFEEYKANNLELNMQRGQPGDDNFDLSNPLLGILDEGEWKSGAGLDIRNYPGGPAGLKEARELFGSILDLPWDQVIVGNNASLKMLSNLLMWTIVKGVAASETPWKPSGTTFIVTTPGYDRHFTLLEALGFSMVSVPMTEEGPDAAEIEKLVSSDASIKGLIFVPTYSNPTGDCLSPAFAKRLASMKTAASDFTIFADDAYIIHHLSDEHPVHPNLVQLCAEAGNPDRAYVFASTSKVTFSGAGIGAMGTSRSNLEWFLPLLGTQFIGPNKVEQYRHVKFLNNFPGEVAGLMQEHGKLLKPKFDAVEEILSKALGGTGLAEWTRPGGGYFVSLNTAKPVADRVIALAAEAGVSLTPAGATFPYSQDPGNRNIRLAPTRPPLAEVRKAMEVVALCVKIASLED